MSLCQRRRSIAKTTFAEPSYASQAPFRRSILDDRVGQVTATPTRSVRNYDFGTNVRYDLHFVACKPGGGLVVLYDDGLSVEFPLHNTGPFLEGLATHHLNLTTPVNFSKNRQRFILYSSKYSGPAVGCIDRTDCLTRCRVECDSPTPCGA